MNRRQFVTALAALPLIGRLSPAAAPTPKQSVMEALKDKGNLFYSVDPAMDRTVYVIHCVRNPGPLSVKNCRFVKWKEVSL